MLKKTPKVPKTPKQSENNSLIVQSNKLINGRFDMTLLEKRIFLKMVSMIKPKDTEFRPLLINASELIHDLDLQGDSLYAEFKKATKRLMQHVCEIRETDGLLQISLASSVKYYEGQGLVEISFDQKLKPYLLLLQNNFTVFGLTEALALKSLSSLRMYELLKQFTTTGTRIINLEELKRCLNLVEQYTKYADFKRYVIVSAQKDLENTDMAFEFVELKVGKKVDRLEFTFQKTERIAILSLQPTIANEQANQGKEEVAISVEEVKPSKINNPYTEIVRVAPANRARAYETLMKLNISDYQAKKVLEYANDAEIFKVAYGLNILVADPKIKNKEAYAYGVLKNKFGIND